jgi:hypothetical protein
MNTMTVQAGALTVSNGSTPTSQNVVAGGQNVTMATIQLDASQSGENVRLSSLPLVLNTTASGDVAQLSNCQLMNGSTALNTGTYVWNGSSVTSPGTSNNVTISFNNSLTIPKGTVLSLPLTCTISSGATNGHTFQWAVANSGFSALGATSGANLSVATSSATAPTMTVTVGGTGDLAASMDSSAPSYTLVSGGTTGVTLNVIRLQSTNEAVNLQKVGLKLTNTASSSAADLTTVYLYSGNNLVTTGGTTIAPNTLLGTVTFTGSNTSATSTLSQVVQIPVNSAGTIVVKADVAKIGTNQPATSGHLIAVDFNNAQGVGANSGATVMIGPGQYTGSNSAGIRIFRAVPVVAIGPAGTTNPNGTSQVLKKFSITAASTDTSASIGIYQIAFGIATSSGVNSLSNLQLHAYTDSGYSQPANVPNTSGGQFGATLGNGSTLYFQQSSPFEIAQGATVYFALTGNVTPTSGATNWNVNVTLLGDSNYPSLAGFMGTASAVAGSSYFVWSPNTTTQSSTSATDWTNGYGVSGLPSTGI